MGEVGEGPWESGDLGGDEEGTRGVHKTMVMAQGARTGGSRRLWVVTAREEGGCGVGGQSRQPGPGWQQGW